VQKQKCHAAHAAVSLELQVCSLPPAWGYEHQGLERFILSFPEAPMTGASNAASRVLKEEADGAMLRRAKRWEDNWAFPLAVRKIVNGIGVGLRTAWKLL
jgi:hypothetical protein